MIYRHLLLEVYCSIAVGSNSFPEYCSVNGSNIGIHCIENRCPNMSCTYCPNEICLTNEQGIVYIKDDLISFGGEMDAEINDEYEINRDDLLLVWRNICRSKIREAYKEYMVYRNTDLIK